MEIHKVCIMRLFNKYAVARTEHDNLVKRTTKIFSNLQNTSLCSPMSQILKNEATLEKTGVHNRLIDTPYLRMEALVSL